MPRTLRIAAFVGITVASAAMPRSTTAQQSGPRLEPYRATSEFTLLPDSNRLTRYVSRSVRFLVHRRGNPRDSTTYLSLVEETVAERGFYDGERDTDGTITLRGWVNPSGTSHSAPTWRTVLHADRGEVWDEFYRALYYGCCDASDELIFVSLRTGAPLFYATGGRWTKAGDRLFVVSVPNSALARYVAFHDVYAAEGPPEEARDSTIVGVLQYGSAIGPVQRVLIRQPAGRGFNYRLDSIRVSGNGRAQGPDEFSLWGSNGRDNAAAMTDFAIEVVLTGGTGIDVPNAVVRVPVVGDQLDLNHSTLPPGLVAHRDTYRGTR